jgi:hypothetical protein
LFQLTEIHGVSLVMRRGPPAGPECGLDSRTGRAETRTLG